MPMSYARQDTMIFPLFAAKIKTEIGIFQMKTLPINHDSQSFSLKLFR